MHDNGMSIGVEIPSMLIGKADGEKITHYLASGREPVTVMLEFVKDHTDDTVKKNTTDAEVDAKIKDG